MRIALAALISLMASAAIDTARADQYRWCAIMDGGNDGGMINCYFVTLQQCQASVTGVGGFCMPSPFAGNQPAPSWNQSPQPRKKKPS